MQIEIFLVGSAIMIFNEIQNDMTGKQTTYYTLFLTNEFGKFISMKSKCNWHFCIHNFTKSYIIQSCQLRCIFTYMMLFSDELALMPRRISAATRLPSLTWLNDSWTSRGHEVSTAWQNDTGSDNFKDRGLTLITTSPWCEAQWVDGRRSTPSWCEFPVTSRPHDQGEFVYARTGFMKSQLTEITHWQRQARLAR